MTFKSTRIRLKTLQARLNFDPRAPQATTADIDTTPYEAAAGRLLDSLTNGQRVSLDTRRWALVHADGRVEPLEPRPPGHPAKSFPPQEE